MKLYIFDVDGVLEKEDRLIPAREHALLTAIMQKKHCTLSEAKKLLSDAKNALPADKRETMIYRIVHVGFTRKEYFAIINSVNPQGLIEPYPGAVDVVKTLAKKHRVVAFSNTPRDALTQTLQIIGVFPYLHHVYSAEDFAESKPSKNIIIHIMKDQGFSPADTISIGNSFEKDVLPSKEAGAYTVLFDPEKKHTKRQKETDRVISTLKELL